MSVAGLTRMRTRWHRLAGCVWLAGCGEGDPCQLEPELLKVQPTAEVDCGRVPQDADDATNEAARQCVLDARAAGKTFRAIKLEPAIDSTAITIYLGLRDGTVAMVSYGNDSFASDGPASFVYESKCDSLRARPETCEQEWISLCLECVKASEPKQLCHGPLAK